jgi:hypothetical protein
VEGKSRRVQRAAQQAMREPRVGFLSATFLYPNKERQLGADAGRSETFSVIRSKSPSSAFGTFSRNGRRKNAVFGAAAGRSETFSAIRSKSPSSAFGTFSRNGRRKDAVFGAAAGRSETISTIRSKSPSSAFGTFSRNGRRKSAVFGAAAGRSEGSDVGLVQLIESAESQVAAIAAMHFSSIAMGVGRAVMPRVVRQGCAVVKCSA